MKKTLVLLLAFALAGFSGYGVFSAIHYFAGDVPEVTASNATPDDSSFSSSSSSSSRSRAPAMIVTPSYVDYQEGQIGNGKSVLLFFKASWDPASMHSDKVLNTLYFAGTPSITTMKINFDIETELASRYRVIRQDTFVLLDGNGKIVKTVTDPPADELEALLK